MKSSPVGLQRGVSERVRGLVDGMTGKSLRALAGSLVRALAASVLVAALPAAPAMAFPDKPVRLVVPFPPGGATDTLARLMAEKLAERWKQPVVVDNRPGGNTAIGTELVAKAPPDGHTLGIVTVSHIINPLLTAKLPYDTLKDLTGVMLLTRFHMALYAHPSLPASTPQELMDLARKEDGRLAYGSATTASYLGMERLNLMAGTRMQYIPYKGSAQALVDLLAGHIPLAIDPILESTLHHVRSGKLKIIGTLGAQRAELTPDVPVLADAVPGHDFSGHFGLVTRSGTPPALIGRIRDDFAAVMKLQDVTERIRTVGQESVASTPEAYNALIRSELQAWEPVVRKTGATID